jgi:peroxiredoxin/glutaredoxin
MELQVGQLAPDFTLPSHLDREVTLSNLRGTTVVLAFFPQAWTPIWSGQIPSYQANLARFAGLNTQVLGISIDHVPCLKAWADSLGGVTYPLLSDFWPHGEVAIKYGVLRTEGYTERAIFIIDKEGIIRYIDIHNIDEQPDNDVLFTELERLNPQLAAKIVPPSPQELPHGGVVMYCTAWCPDCKRARIWLKENNIPYTEVDVTTFPGANKQVRRWANGNLTTPTFDIDGTIVVEFDQVKLTKILVKR